MKHSANEGILYERFLWLSVVTTLILMAVVIVSINSFGEASWEGRRQVGIVLSGGKDEPGRNRAHYEGLKKACDIVGCDLHVRENVSDNIGAGKKAVAELIKNGATTIFLTDSSQAADIADITEQYPSVRFFLVGLYSLNKGSVREYSVRDYEPRYLAGMLAGMRTKTGRVGYVAPFSSSGVNRGINAFVLGVKRVNPYAETLIVFTGSTNNRAHEEQSVQSLKAARVDFLTYHQDSDAVAYAAERAGIPFVSFHESYKDCGRCLGAIKINWSSVYIDMLRSDNAAANSVTVWPGMVEGIIDLELINKKLTNRERAAIETARAYLLLAKPIFSGDIYDRSGGKRCNAGESISGNYIRSEMGWLVQGVTIIDN